MLLKSKFFVAIKYILFLSVGVFIFWFIYKDQDLDHMKNDLKNNADYIWIYLAVFLGILSHLARAYRWRILIEPLGKKPRMINTFIAVMFVYLMNLVIPRAGEVARCGIISKYEKISFSKLLGTVVVERAVDIVMLLIFTIITVLTQLDGMAMFLKNNPEIQKKINRGLTSPHLIFGLAFVASALLILKYRFGNSPLVQKFRGVTNSFVEGLTVVKKMKRKWVFIFHSVFIWTMYFLMTYLAFNSFDFTASLPLLSGLTVFVLGSFGMVAPVQGGIGTWHFMTVEGLKIYGVKEGDGLTFAFLLHTSMTLMFAMGGLILFAILPLVNRHRTKTHKNN